MIRQRNGHSLVELIVALPIAAILSTVAMSLLLDAHRLARRLQSSTEIARELRQATAVLASEIRPLSATDVISWSDTSLEVQAMVGSGVVCAFTSPNVIDMLPLTGNDVLRTSWFATPQGGDNVWTIAPDTMPMPASERWAMSTMKMESSVAASLCTSRKLFAEGNAAATRVIRLTLSGTPTISPRTGTLVRITRRARYSLYKASDGLWYLGRKSLNPSGWTTIQPVAGPLDTPARKGLVVQMRDSADNIFNFGIARTPRGVALKLRAATQWQKAGAKPGVVDSVLVHITLRGQGGGS